MKILCVDDDRTTLTLMIRSLTRVCPEDEILAAASGQEAIEKLEENDVDLMITDLMMPGITGMEVLDKAKKICADTEVIMITAFSSVESAVEAMQKGARDFLAKPINLDLLVEKVENLKEFLVSRREVKEYQYAMTVIDDDLLRTVESAERKLSEHRGILARIAEVLEDDLSTDEKLERISETLGLLVGSGDN